MSVIFQQARGASEYSRIERDGRSFVGGNSITVSETEQPKSDGWNRAIDDLLRIRNLEDDWDGEGSEAPAGDLVDYAILLAMQLQSQGWSGALRVVPGVNSTIFFEWHNQDGYLEVEVSQPRVVEGWFVPKGSNQAISVVLPQA